MNADTGRAQRITDNLNAVNQRIHAAARAAGRSVGEIRLVAVSKKMPSDDIAAALAAGQRDFGENYAQELRDKQAVLPAQGTTGPLWHYIGPLQSNKVKYVAGRCALVHTLDSGVLLDEMNRRVPQGVVQDCLLQVNIADEAQKRGTAPDDVAGLLDRFADLAGLRCVGLMIIPPWHDDPETARPYFSALRKLRDDLARQQRPRVELRELSMGMSHDLEVAIAEGATLVRVGTAIFGPRTA